VYISVAVLSSLKWNLVKKCSSFNMSFHNVTEKMSIHCRLPYTRLG